VLFNVIQATTVHLSQRRIIALVYTIIKTTSVGDARLPLVGVAGWPVILTGWPMMVGVVEVGAVNTRLGVSQPGEDAERYRWCIYTAHRGWLGVVKVSVRPRLGHSSTI